MTDKVQGGAKEAKVEVKAKDAPETETTIAVITTAPGVLPGGHYVEPGWKGLIEEDAFSENWMRKIRTEKPKAKE